MKPEIRNGNARLGKMKSLLSAFLVVFGASSSSAHTEKEKQVWKALNELRQDPPSFVADLQALRSRFDDKKLRTPPDSYLETSEGVAVVEEALAFLKKAKRQEPLQWSPLLARSAQALVDDQGKTGDTGHIASDGSTPEDRINRLAQAQASWGENISYGDYGGDTGRDVIISWLVDDGVKNRGHRKNLLRDDYGVAGVACGPHPKYDSMCVIDFADAVAEIP
jgi:uncharacterized protein YkwD